MKTIPRLAAHTPPPPSSPLNKGMPLRGLPHGDQSIIVTGEALDMNKSAANHDKKRAKRRCFVNASAGKRTGSILRERTDCKQTVEVLAKTLFISDTKV